MNTEQETILSNKTERNIHLQILLFSYSRFSFFCCHFTIRMCVQCFGKNSIFSFNFIHFFSSVFVSFSTLASLVAFRCRIRLKSFRITNRIVVAILIGLDGSVNIRTIWVETKWTMFSLKIIGIVQLHIAEDIVCMNTHIRQYTKWVNITI